MLTHKHTPCNKCRNSYLLSMQRKLLSMLLISAWLRRSRALIRGVRDWRQSRSVM